MASKIENKAPKLKDYIPIVGENTIDELKLIAKHLKGKKIQHINSTRVGGGVAEMLTCVLPLMKELGVDIEWDIIEGNPDFFNVTKKFHNALHGREESLTDKDFDIYLDTARSYIDSTKIKGDVVFVHDPQPIALIQNKKKLKKVRWIWRCHVDVSAPSERVWDFLSTFIEGYDASMFSSPKFTRPLKIPQFLICPAIDPLSKKNMPLEDSEIDEVLHRYGIDKKKPIISQVSRYDYLKDPIGVIESFKLVKKYIDAQLILIGNSAADDPEGAKVLEEVKESAEGTADIHILLIPPEQNDTDVNALQRASSVIVQKSLKEGFALTVTEALWKGKPVVASAVGGIPLQIKHKYSGLLCHCIEGAALQIRQFLQNPAFAKRLAANGKAHIKRNFLITRLIREHMLLALSLFHKGDVITL
ncbi:MAG: glycosyltransferase [Candidatus Omnitrophica bacterium]|nr:glycosyltransferase [Candidatus Omnitrophota bacterium]